jgi:uncharacterized protein YdaU (DUF1376 family)
MTFYEQGLYVYLLCRQWQVGSIPSDVSSIARIVKEPLEIVQAAWERIGPCWTPRENGTLVQERLEREKLALEDFSARQAERGKLGGRPPKPGKPPLSEGLANEKRTKSERKAAKKPKKSIDIDTDILANARISAVLQRPEMPELPDRLPDDVSRLKHVALPFLEVFANSTSEEALKKHGPVYTQVLATMRSRGVNTKDAWQAFTDAWLVRNGAPLFGDLAKTALSYLPVRNGTKPQANERTYHRLDPSKQDGADLGVK